MIPRWIILGFTLAAAAVFAYGGDPGWMRYAHGLQIILLARTFQWLVVGSSLVGCAVLIALVLTRRCSAVWLIGLTPVLALFFHHYVADPARGMLVNPDAQFTPADQVHDLADDDYVVGLNFGGDAYAYPFAALYHDRVVAQSEPRRRLLLFWSAFANRAVAIETDWTVKPRELEIVGEPANALLVCNVRLGEFINGLTGLTTNGRTPSGFETFVPTVKTTWKQWRQLHPQTFVLRPAAGLPADGPTGPLLPRYPMGHKPYSATPVTFIQTPLPAAIAASEVTSTPLNLDCQSEPLLLLRGDDGISKAFLRQANGDLTPRFFPVSLPNAALGERDSGSSWTDDGLAVAGPLKGERLRPLDVDDNVYLEVMRFWYPNLQWIVPTPADRGQAPIAPTHRRAIRAARHHRARRVKLSS